MGCFRARDLSDVIGECIVLRLLGTSRTCVSTAFTARGSRNEKHLPGGGRGHSETKLLENEKSARSFPAQSFSETPQVMDVHAFGSRTSALKKRSCAPSDGEKALGPGHPPGRLRDIPPKNFMFR